MDATTLKPAQQIARDNPVRFPNESAAYRAARNALLAEEIELRRHIERVAEHAPRAAAGRRGDARLPLRGRGRPGRRSPACSATRRRWRSTATCSGRSASAPCPMCTSLLAAWDGKAADVAQRIALVVVARSPIERLVSASAAGQICAWSAT